MQIASTASSAIPSEAASSGARDAPPWKRRASHAASALGGALVVVAAHAVIGRITGPWEGGLPLAAVFAAEFALLVAASLAVAVALLVPAIRRDRQLGPRVRVLGLMTLATWLAFHVMTMEYER